MKGEQMESNCVVKVGKQKFGKIIVGKIKVKNRIKVKTNEACANKKLKK